MLIIDIMDLIGLGFMGLFLIVGLIWILKIAIANKKAKRKKKKNKEN